ncbi:amino acid ABC transporter permease [Rhizobium puerariae]|uniref:Amino acid ABC transporter permease n=1 Tax=Rhizobium puerariae TaxID=1585791 RepID=A0ABV6AEJ3_9HYPH
MILGYMLTWLVMFAGVFLLMRFSLAALGSRNMSVDFGFLRYPANFDIGNSLLPFSGSDSYAKALFVGFLNTIKAAIACIAFATVVGTLIGVLRLSSNPPLRGCAGLLIEVLRNVPPLLQLFAWSAIIQFSLPLPRDAWEPVGGVVLSNRGIWFPFLTLTGEHSVLTILGCGLVAAAALFTAWRLVNRDPVKGFWWLVISALLAGTVLLFLSGSIVADLPEKRGFNFRGGMSVTPEFAALVISLTLYTSGYMAEIVRGAVLSVPAGQSEAASALGFRYLQTLRLIVLPQAVRIAIPPMTNQYINVTKSTSLAVAVGYSDIVSVGNTIMNQSGRAIEVIAIFVAAYLLLNLVISEIMNRLNRRLSLA